MGSLSSFLFFCFLEIENRSGLPTSQSPFMALGHCIFMGVFCKDDFLPVF